MFKARHLGFLDGKNHRNAVLLLEIQGTEFLLITELRYLLYVVTQ